MAARPATRPLAAPRPPSPPPPGDYRVNSSSSQPALPPGPSCPSCPEPAGSRLQGGGGEGWRGKLQCREGGREQDKHACWRQLRPCNAHGAVARLSLRPTGRPVSGVVLPRPAVLKDQRGVGVRACRGKRESRGRGMHCCRALPRRHLVAAPAGLQEAAAAALPLHPSCAAALGSRAGVLAAAARRRAPALPSSRLGQNGPPIALAPSGEEAAARHDAAQKRPESGTQGSGEQPAPPVEKRSRDADTREGGAKGRSASAWCTIRLSSVYSGCVAGGGGAEGREREGRFEGGSEQGCVVGSQPASQRQQQQHGSRQHRGKRGASSGSSKQRRPARAPASPAAAPPCRRQSREP